LSIGKEIAGAEFSDAVEADGIEFLAFLNTESEKKFSLSSLFRFAIFLFSNMNINVKQYGSRTTLIKLPQHGADFAYGWCKTFQRFTLQKRLT